MTLDRDQLNDTDDGILDLLAEGRITPRYAAGELNRQQPYISQRLKRLLEHGHVRRVDRGLYELDDDPRDADKSADTSGAAGEDRDGPPTGPNDLAPGEDPPETLLSDDQEARLRDELAGSGAKLDGRVDAVRRMYGRLRALGEAEKADLLEVVDVDATEYAHADSVWANVAKGHLSTLPGVEVDQTGTWRYDPEV